MLDRSGPGVRRVTGEHVGQRDDDHHDSAGCVHLSMTASAKFYATLDVGDPVEVVV